MALMFWFGRRLSLRYRAPRFVTAGVLTAFAAVGCASCQVQPYPARLPQGEAVPIAPTVAEWNALPPGAAFTYHVTEIPSGGGEDNSVSGIKAYAINNSAQVVGSITHTPATAPAWVRALLHLPYLSRFNHLKYRPQEQTAFIFDKNRTEALPYLNEAVFAEAHAINERGQIAGVAQIGDAPFGYGTLHAVLWDNVRAAPRDIGAQATGLQTRVFGINARGQVGILSDRDRTAYLWDNKVRVMASRLSQNRPPEAVAFGLNDRGEAIGFLPAPSKENENQIGGVPAFLSVTHAPVVMSALQVNHAWRVPVARNNRGDMIAANDDGFFFYQNGTKPVRLEDVAMLLNQNGDTLGYRFDESGSYRGLFVRHKDHLYKVADCLPQPFPYLVDTAACMNDRGQIVISAHRAYDGTNGSITDTTPYHLFLLTPVLPAPPNQNK